MERHRHWELYKDSFRSSRNYKESLREKKIEARAKQHDAHRQISISPTPRRLTVSERVAEFEERLTSTPLPPNAKNKENVGVAVINNSKEDRKTENCVKFTSSQIAQVACAPNDTSLSRKEAYLKRFIEWRNKKREQELKKKEVRNVWKPVGPLTTSSSNVLKQHETITKAKPKEKEEEKKRESFYKIIGTPEKKTIKNQPENSLARRVMQQALAMKKEGLITISNVKPSSLKTIRNKNIKESQVQAKLQPSNQKPMSSNKARLEPTKSSSSSTVNKTKKPLAKSKNVITSDFIQQEVKPLVANSVRRPNVINKNGGQNASTGITARATRTITNNDGAGAIGKAKVAQVRNIVSNSAVVNNHKNIKLGTNMKAYKKSNVNCGTTSNGKQIRADKNVNRFWALRQTNAPILVSKSPEIDDLVPEKIIKYVTSTQHKCDNVADDFVVETDISPIEQTKSPVGPVALSHTSSSAKRALLLPKGKFNFVRYSSTNTNEIDTSLLIPMPAELDQTVNNEDATIVPQKHNISVKPKPKTSISLVEDDTLTNGIATTSDHCTPPPVKGGNDERPVNYLSPFVSVSRGKVNLKSECERRNSMYLANEEGTPKKSSYSKVITTTPPQTPIEVRRTLESVRYFRQQLKDETTRLREKCTSWEEYKAKNLLMLQELNCDDKIDATVGQTLLLTGNKFEQFNRLINRCEAGATGIGAVEDNGSEDTKLVSAVDLEGFWAMLGLQIENVEKRFAEIERWKENNWQDPDFDKALAAARSNAKKKVSGLKVVGTTKTKAKPSNGILELMRKKHAEIREMKNAAAVNESNNRSNGEVPVGTLKRRSIIVPNCKQFSPAATVLSITNGKRRSSIGPKGHRNVTTSSEIAAAKVELRKTTNLGSKTTEVSTPPSHQQPSHNFSSPPVRKSILKTPGTKKSARKSVIFSKKKLVRRFQFTFDEPTISDDEEQQMLQHPQGHREARSGDVITEFEDTTADVSPSEQASDSDFNNFKIGNGDNGGTPARCYTLRNRKVKLRPSFEIIIPQ